MVQVTNICMCVTYKQFTVLYPVIASWNPAADHLFLAGKFCQQPFLSDNPGVSENDSWAVTSSLRLASSVSLKFGFVSHLDLCSTDCTVVFLKTKNNQQYSDLYLP